MDPDVEPFAPFLARQQSGSRHASWHNDPNLYPWGGKAAPVNVSLYKSYHGHEASSQQENLDLDKDGSITQAKHNEANLMNLWNKVSKI